MSIPSRSFDEVLQSALILSEAERAAIAHQLLLSIDEPEPAGAEAEEEWEAMLQSRLDAADRGEFAEGDWRDSLERIRKSLRTNEGTP